ncbi:MAG: hypothetical protein NVSMB9_31170 [Isosphaeraceae bacterium]
MIMKHVRIKCPGCERSNLRVSPSLLGHMVKCKHCGAQFLATETESSGTGQVQGLAAAQAESVETSATDGRYLDLKKTYDRAIRRGERKAAEASAYRKDRDRWKSEARSLRTELESARAMGLQEGATTAEIPDHRLSRELAEVREANARLRALLDLFGYSPGAPDHADLRQGSTFLPSPAGSGLPGD